MQALTAKIAAPGATPTLNVFGIKVEVLLSGKETAGRCCTYICTVAPGDGPPPHIHACEEETFYVLEGRFEILCGDQVTTAEVGTLAFVPRGVCHTFKNIGEATGRVLGTATPAGHEQFFAEVDRLSRNGPLSLEAAIAVCRKHGMELVLPAAS